MPALSSLHSKKLNDQIVHFGKVYASHRPLVQRILNISFAIYVIGTTYRALSPKNVKGKAKGKDVPNKPANGKPPRVAVSF